jgi:hypothetical protein
MSERTLQDLLHFGDVLVEVGFGLGGSLEARTVSSIIGHVDLGGEISVTLYDDNLAEHTEEGRPYAKPEAWAEILREMRDMLARCMILGRMEVVSGGEFTLDMDEENLTSIEEAEQLLGQRFFHIDFDTVIAALRERRERQERVRRGLLRMSQLMAEEGFRRGLNREERAKMTLGEA